MVSERLPGSLEMGRPFRRTAPAHKIDQIHFCKYFYNGAPVFRPGDGGGKHGATPLRALIQNVANTPKTFQKRALHKRASRENSSENPDFRPFGSLIRTYSHTPRKSGDRMARRDMKKD